MVSATTVRPNLRALSPMETLRADTGAMIGRLPREAQEDGGAAKYTPNKLGNICVAGAEVLRTPGPPTLRELVLPGLRSTSAPATHGRPFPDLRGDVLRCQF